MSTMIIDLVLWRRDFPSSKAGYFRVPQSTLSTTR